MKNIYLKPHFKTCELRAEERLAQCYWHVGPDPSQPELPPECEMIQYHVPS